MTHIPYICLSVSLSVTSFYFEEQNPFWTPTKINQVVFYYLLRLQGKGKGHPCTGTEALYTAVRHIEGVEV